MKSAILGAAALALSAVSAHAQAAKPLIAYPGGWDTSHAGSSLPSAALHGEAFMDKFEPLTIGADGAPDVHWYAPIHSKLGTATLAQPKNRQAIVNNRGLHLNTLNPSSGGIGGTDVNLQTMDSKGDGFALMNGYVEASLTPPAAHGVHYGFWALTRANPAGTYPGHAEVDIIEGYGAADKGVHQGVHAWQNGASEVSLPTNYFVPSGGLYTGASHTFGIYLTPSEIYLYMDRKETARVARQPYQQAPFYFLLSVFTDANRSDGYQPATMGVWDVYAWGG